MMDAVFLKLLNMSLTAGWLILAVIALRLVLKKAPKWTRCALWGMVGLRLVLPFSVESALSLIPSAETISPNIGYASTPGITSGILALNQAVNPIISESLSPTAGASVNPLQIWTTVAGYVWLAGIAAMLLYTAISYIRLRRRVDTAVLLRDNIWQSENVKSPFILGLFQPLIYLPFNMTEENMTNVLAHENAHLKRRDHLIKPLAFLLLTVYWFNPLVWLAYVLLCRDIELACDERVVKVLDVQQRRDYGAALLSCSVSRKSIAACPLAFGEVGVKERIKTVLNYKKPAFWIIIAAVVACIVVALCFLTNPKDEKLYAPDPFGFGYSVESIIFESGTYGFSYTPETAPDYRVTDDSQFMVLEDKSSDSWLNAGTFEPVELTKDNFDRYFRGVKGPAAGLRRDNNKAWRLLVTDLPETVFYYLLLQDNGDIYLTYGYYDALEIDDPYSDDSSIRWVFKLKQEAELDSELSAISSMATAWEWFDCLHGDEMVWDGRREINLDEFPGVTFRWLPERVDAVTDTEIIPLYTGMPVWSVFLRDLTGDGKPELCSTLSIGSGIVDNRIIVYDYAAGASYELSDRMNYDYTLRLQDGRLLVEKRPYMSDELIESGLLSYKDGAICVEGMDTSTSTVGGVDEPSLAYETAYVWVSYSEDGYNAMVERAENRDTERRYGNVSHLTPVVKLGSKSDYDAFYEEMSAYFDLTQGYDEVGSFSELAGRYTEDFFTENALFIAYLEETSTSYRHEVEYAGIENGIFEIGIHLIAPSESDTAMAGWFMCVAVPKAIIANCSGYDAYICVMSDQSDVFPSGELVRTYSFEGDDMMHIAAVSLYDSGEFIFTFSPLSSYIGHGTYTTDSDRLTLKTDDGNYTYVFDMVDDTLVFDAGASSSMTWYSGVENGSIFQ